MHLVRNYLTYVTLRKSPNLSLIIYFLYFIDVQLIYGVLIPAVQQRDSVIHI